MKVLCKPLKLIFCGFWSLLLPLPLKKFSIAPTFIFEVVVVGWRRGKMIPGPRVRWGWCGPTGGQGGGGQQREWGLRREGVKVDLQWGQVSKRRKPCPELGDLEGCRPHILRGQIRGMSGTAEEVGHRVVGGLAIGVGGVIGPAYRVAVGLKLGTMARTELGEGAAEWTCSSCSAGSIGWGRWEGGGLGRRLLSSCQIPATTPDDWGDSPVSGTRQSALGYPYQCIQPNSCCLCPSGQRSPCSSVIVQGSSPSGTPQAWPTTLHAQTAVMPTTRGGSPLQLPHTSNVTGPGGYVGGTSLCCSVQGGWCVKQV